MPRKSDFLKVPVEHVSLETFDPVPLLDAMERMSFQARNLARAARIYETMLRDPECSVILCLAGSLVSAGLRRVIAEMVEHRMVDAIVATGANIVDQDFFEGLGFRHWIGSPDADDELLRRLHIDRIYDTYIDEDELRICDETVARIADSLEPRPYSSREFIREMGRYLTERGADHGSIVEACYQRDVPIFCPAFSDSSAGFGLVEHQWRAAREGRPPVTIDSAKDFLELTRIKLMAGETGLLMVGGGVPKNFAQDVVVAGEVLGFEVAMHRYAVQITVADVRDGALSGSTLAEAHSWGKVDRGAEQMVFGEATVLLPLLAGYAYHRRAWEGRADRRFSRLLDEVPVGEERGALERA